jgi:phosphoenolpyruvate synthase/pyruvate phosphate dikinase
VKLDYLVGTMIEIPRGALTADEIAQSRISSASAPTTSRRRRSACHATTPGSFLPQYAELEIVKKNPFATIDQTGVGQLVEIAVSRGRATRPGLKLGICGEHGGDPSSSPFLREGRTRLRELLPLPGAGRAAGRRAGGLVAEGRGLTAAADRRRGPENVW